MSRLARLLPAICICESYWINLVRTELTHLFVKSVFTDYYYYSTFIYLKTKQLLFIRLFLRVHFIYFLYDLSLFLDPLFTCIYSICTLNIWHFFSCIHCSMLYDVMPFFWVHLFTVSEHLFNCFFFHLSYHWQYNIY